MIAPINWHWRFQATDMGTMRMGLLIQDVNDVIVNVFRLLRGVANAGQAQFAELRQTAHQVKDRTCLGDAVEMQLMVGDDIHQVTGQEALITVFLQIIGSDVVFGFALLVVKESRWVVIAPPRE